MDDQIKLRKMRQMLMDRPWETLIDVGALVDVELDMGISAPGTTADLRDFVEDEWIEEPIRYQSGRRLSVFKGAYNSRPSGDTSLERVAIGIRTSATLKRHYDVLQRLAGAAVGRYKAENLPAITPSALFSERRGNRQSFVHSGHVVIDIDGIDDAPSVLTRLVKSPQVALAFISPSGNGIKAIIAVDPIPETPVQHQAAYHYVAVLVAGLLGIKVDISHDVSRLCFLTHDPDVYLNVEPEPIRWQWGFEPPPRKTYVPDVPVSAEQELADALQALSSIQGQIEYRDMIRIIAALHNDIGSAAREPAIEWMMSVRGHRGCTRQRAEDDWDRVAGIKGGAPMTEVHLGSLYWYAKRHGHRRREPESRDLPVLH